ncbi:hypothetical protein MesoLj113c_43580 [Mesorhizobium sp. 113-3-9]|uniref:hypothetical protein n=1 Tax=Mesorhizobium sp. 113-3-9 TaxID=2744517 RepID=UPI0019256C60|nr:hypothetical protein [Mesorhizobium sp. 113-3-9]BCG88248.1 hypothetical protein MesoLj113c_43580 [Mesorhizobium sp. 113-3-9]
MQETGRQRGDEIKEAGTSANDRTLNRRALAALLIRDAPGIAARQHRGQELDADGQPDDQAAESKFVMDKQRQHRQRQADAEIAAEQRRDDPGCGTGKISRRGIRPVRRRGSEC